MPFIIALMPPVLSFLISLIYAALVGTFMPYRAAHEYLGGSVLEEWLIITAIAYTVLALTLLWRRLR